MRLNIYINYNKINKQIFIIVYYETLKTIMYNNINLHFYSKK